MEVRAHNAPYLMGGPHILDGLICTVRVTMGRLSLCPSLGPVVSRKSARP